MVDYDLVILGGTLAGRHAAQVAAALDARVALIEPNQDAIAAELYRQAFISASQQFSQTPDYDWMQQQLRTVVDALMEAQLNLRSQFHPNQTGIDIVTGVPEFVPSPRLSVLVNQHPAAIRANQNDDPVPLLRSPEQSRVLRSRAYLIANDGPAFVPEIAGLDTVPYLTLDTLPQLMDNQRQPCPRSVIVLGDDPRGLEIGQAFLNLGCAVTLLTPQLPLLPREDTAIARTYQTWLEAAGMQILPLTAVQSVQSVQLPQTEPQQIQVNLHPDWLSHELNSSLFNRTAEEMEMAAARRAEPATQSLQTQVVSRPKTNPAATLQADLLIVAAGYQSDFSAFSPIMKLRRQRNRLMVNSHLRTSHRRIYACGPALGGYALSHVAQHEAELAVRNSLFFPTRSVSYGRMPYAIATRPALVRVGLTEQQAQQRYGEDAWVFCQSLHERELVRSQPLTGLVKLIAHRNGLVLGVHVIGTEAQEAISAIALAMQQDIPLAHMAQLPNLPFTWGAILAQLAEQWQIRRNQANWRRELRETWFSFRRSWTR